MYVSGWKMRILRSFLSDILLEVTLATQAEPNSMRAFAMSTVFDMTGMHTACMAFTGDFTMLSIMSMSCIIRSSTTSTSVLLSGNGESRLHKKERKIRI